MQVVGVTMMAACRPIRHNAGRRPWSSLLHKCPVPAPGPIHLRHFGCIRPSYLPLLPASLLVSTSIADSEVSTAHPLCTASLGSQVAAALIGLTCRKLPEPDLSTFLSSLTLHISIIQWPGPVADIERIVASTAPTPHIPAEQPTQKQ